MTDSKHSPLPWKADGTTIAFIDGAYIRHIADLSQIERTTDECEADADFIVRAVNSHGELIAIARWIASKECGCGTLPPCMHQIACDVLDDVKPGWRGE